MTTRLLLAYHSSEGQTEKIANRIAEVMRADDVSVDLVDAEENPDPSGYDGVVFGDSIHAGKHSRSLARYLTRHADELESVPVALFQVSLTSATDDEEHTTEAHAMLQRLLDATGLDPEIVGLFAGALRYTQYGWLKKHMMSSIAKSDVGDSDTSRDFEYTDWEAVEHFAKDVVSTFTNRD